MSASIRLTKNNHRGPSLLKQIDGLKRSDSLESLSRKAAIDQRKSVATLETPMKDDTGSPLDSDGDSTIRNPDIKRSQFRRGNGVAEQKGEKKVLPTRVSGRIRSTAKGNGSISSCSTSSSGKRGFEGDDEEHIPRSSSHSQPSNSQGIGSQHGIFGSSQSKRPKTYGGGKAQKSFGSSQNQLGSSPEKKEPKTQFKKPLTLPSTPEPESSPEIKRTKPVFKTFAPNLYDSPDRPKTGETKPVFKTFAPNLYDSPERPRTGGIKATLKTDTIEFDSPDGSGTDERTIPKFIHRIGPTSPVKKAKNIKRKDTGLSDDDDSELPELGTETIEARNIRRRLREKEEEEGPQSPVAKFKFHHIPEFEDSKIFQDLGLTQMDLEMAAQETTPDLPDHLVQCPLCKEPVEKTFLEEFSCGERMTVAAQTRFCHSHRTNSAKEDWTSRGYPQINWDTLNSRINQHHQYLRSLLKPDASSYYHQQMTNALKSLSKNKRSLKNIIHSGGSLTPGYYGTRGLRIMSENIMDEFTPQLRKLAAKDDLIFAQGVSSFVQTVLVPELAVRLIQEDMQVEAEEARDILKESAGVGDLLQEELDEVVVRRPREEEDSGIY